MDALRAPRTACGDSWRARSARSRAQAAASATFSVTASQGKLPVRERIDRLLDPGSPFLELSPLAAWDMYDDEAPGAGLVTGIGRVVGPRGAHRGQRRHRQGRHLLPDHREETPPRATDRARKPPPVRLPGRLRRRLPADAGRGLSRPRALRPHLLQPGAMSAAGIPQIAVVMGSCTAGGAYVPAMSDETVIVKGTGTIFLGGPPLVKAATGEEVSAEELGGADVHTRLSGVADYLAEDDAHALQLTRTIVSHAATTHKTLPADVTAPEEPAYDPAELYGIVSADPGKPYDVREVIARIVDGSRFDEFKQRYATDARHRLCPAARLPRRHRRQQRRALLGVGAQGHALHRALQPARRAARVPAEHHRLHGGPPVRARRHRQGRRQDGARRRQLGRPEVHGHHRRVVRRRQLRDVRPRLRSAVPLDVAERTHLGDGRRTGGRGAGDGQARSAGARGQDAERRGGARHPAADPREVRTRGVALLLHRPPLGRRHHRSGAHARGAGARRSRRASTRRSRRRSSASSGCDRCPCSSIES